jgi:hypothetical protein
MGSRNVSIPAVDLENEISAVPRRRIEIRRQSWKSGDMEPKNETTLEKGGQSGNLGTGLSRWGHFRGKWDRLPENGTILRIAGRLRRIFPAILIPAAVFAAEPSLDHAIALHTAGRLREALRE